MNPCNKPSMMISINTYENVTQIPILANANGANPRPVVHAFIAQTVRSGWVAVSGGVGYGQQQSEEQFCARIVPPVVKAPLNTPDPMSVTDTAARCLFVPPDVINM